MYLTAFYCITVETGPHLTYSSVTVVLRDFSLVTVQGVRAQWAVTLTDRE